MWAAAAGRPRRRVPDDRAWTCPGTGRRADGAVHARRRRPTRLARRSTPSRGRAGGRRRPVARRLRRDGARRARTPERVRGLVLSGATAEPVGVRMLPYLALAAVMDGVDAHGSTSLNAWFFRRRFPPAIAEPIVAGGFWSRGGAAALRALAGEPVPAAPGGLPRPDADHQRRARPAVPALRRGVRAGRARTRGGSAWPAPRTSPTSTGRRPSTRPSAGSRGRSTPS